MSAEFQEPNPLFTTSRLRERAWIGPAMVLAAAIAMCVWTWQTWADVLVDFGVQLYVPWRLSAGEVLYRDIAHYTGPISVYYNALAFRLFGTSLLTLDLANLPILAGIIFCIYQLALKLGGRGCAIVCGISFVTLFGFAHLTPAGNYNFVCPYEYEYTHATLLCLLGVMALGKLADGGGAKYAGIAGFLAGLVFLTRSEFFVATMASAVAGLILFSISCERGWQIRSAWLVFLLALPLPFLVSVACLSGVMPIATAARGALGMWPSLLRGQVAGQLFYRHSMGLDDVGLSLKLLAQWSAIYTAIIVGLLIWAIRAGGGRWTTRQDSAVEDAPPFDPSQGLVHEYARPGTESQRSAPAHAAMAMLIAAFVMGYSYRSFDWKSVFRPLPVVMAVILVCAARGFYSRRNNPAAHGIWARAILLALLAFALLGKVIFYARIIQYGCWLAMPATMVLLIALFGWIPGWIRTRGGAPDVYLAGIGTVWTIVILVMLWVTGAQVRRLTQRVGAGPDAFWADQTRGGHVNTAVELVKRLVPPDRTVACFPEGIIINYLARRRTPTPYVNFNPPDLLLFGQSRMLAALSESPPDCALLVHKDTSEFGERFFGRDYGQRIYQWLILNYRVQELPTLDLGAEPLQGDHFGIRLLQPIVRQRPTQKPDDAGGIAGKDSRAAASTSRRE
jgi:hypothetical protein